MLTIERRERFNSLDVETAQDLRKAGLQLARDAAVRAVVLRGDGGVFCSGADLKYIRAGGDGDGPRLPARPRRAAGAGGLRRGLQADPRVPPQHDLGDPARAQAVHRRRRRHRGGGRLRPRDGCDLVFASERATFEWAYGKTGLTGAESSTFLLPRLVGLRRAMELVLLNPRLDAARRATSGW